MFIFVLVLRYWDPLASAWGAGLLWRPFLSRTVRQSASKTRLKLGTITGGFYMLFCFDFVVLELPPPITEKGLSDWEFFGILALSY